ncbi:unnamed protein product [Malus baccata var. baccata]
MATWHMCSDAGNNYRWYPDPKPEVINGVVYRPSESDRSSSSRVPSMGDVLLQGCSKLAEAEIRNQVVEGGGVGMFRNGFGKPVAVKQSSLAKASSLLLGSQIATPSGQVQATIMNNRSGCGGGGAGGGGGCVGGLSNSLFHTGSGKMVNISPDSLVRAKTLLGFQDDDNAPTKIVGFGFNSAALVAGTPLIMNKTVSLQTRFQNDPERLNLTPDKVKPSSIKFHTAGGRSISVSTDAIQRARSLLGDPELGNFFNEANAGDLGFAFSKGSPHDNRTPISHQKKINNFLTNTSPSPLQPLPNQLRSSAISSGTNLITQFDGVSNETASRSNSKLAYRQNPLSKTHNTVENNCWANGIDLRTNHVGMPPATPLFDISNAVGTPATNNTQMTGLKRRLGRSSISPFKASPSPLQPLSNQLWSSTISSGTNLITQFDGVSNETASRSNSELPYRQNPLSKTHNTVENNCLANGIGLRTNHAGKPPAKPLIDISNTVGTTAMNTKQITGVKRRLGRSSISPFKKPRTNSSTPLPRNVPLVPNGVSTLSSDHSCSKRRVSTRYPSPVTRMYVKKYFGMPRPDQNMLECLSDPVRRITATNAEKYTFLDESGLNCIGAEAFVHMLACYGAAMQYTSREWVTNHYKWIVWKLACYERYYPAKSFGKFLTVSNVLEELKYRYEREVNHGHRSAIKKILEGDASPSSLVVLCISAIRSNCDPNMETSSGAENSSAAKVELTDGWYSVDAVLDALLSKQLASGKLFVGQKLRIWGAALSGWAGPVSPLEVSRQVSLRLHINGTYRAHWADQLGFCKGVCAPLAFKCAKSGGGPVPCTLVGVKRIYPVLYKERLSNGRSIVRSERLETQMVESHQQRRSNVIEGVISEFQRGLEHSHLCNDSDDEGAKLLKILQTAAEPEILMAEMSAEQLKSFTKYQAKLEAIKQSDMEKSILKALEDAGLSEREVTPFMRVRVVGLTRKLYQGKDCSKEGLITIWNPSEKQNSELVEGCAYSIFGLIPTSSDGDILKLLARGSTTKWQPLSQQAINYFEGQIHLRPFFSPRESVLLSDLGKVPLSSEFDIAASVVFVGEAYIAAQQKKQWVFVTDGSKSELKSEGLCDSLLAICFSSPYIDNVSNAPINYNLTGSTVGFCNLTKREKDEMNCLWVAEATENSAYFLTFDNPRCSHLKDAAASSERWKRMSILCKSLDVHVPLFIDIDEGRYHQLHNIVSCNTSKIDEVLDFM